jgi:hypothetical protein
MLMSTEVSGGQYWNRLVLRPDADTEHAILELGNDDTDQIHRETAHQSRWALGIGLTIFGF